MSVELLGHQGTGTGRVIRTVGAVLIVASMLGTSGTSSSYPSRAMPERTTTAYNPEATPSRVTDDVPSTARGILSIRQMANLTWDETASLFSVSRRTVHWWANGRRPSAEQERKLNRILGILSSHQNLSPTLLRERLMSSARPGTLFFELLSSGQFEAFQDLFSTYSDSGQFSRPAGRVDTGRTVRQAPTLLLDALQDRPFAVGTAIPNKSVRRKSQVS